MNKMSALLMTELKLLRSLAMKLRLDAHQHEILRQGAARLAPLPPVRRTHPSGSKTQAGRQQAVSLSRALVTACLR